MIQAPPTFFSSHNWWNKKTEFEMWKRSRLWRDTKYTPLNSTKRKVSDGNNTWFLSIYRLLLEFINSTHHKLKIQFVCALDFMQASFLLLITYAAKSENCGLLITFLYLKESLSSKLTFTKVSYTDFVGLFCVYRYLKYIYV